LLISKQGLRNRQRIGFLGGHGNAIVDHASAAFKPQLALSGAILLALLVGDGIFLALKWLFRREKVIASLEHSAWSSVRIRRFHQIFFPSPGCVAEDLTFERDSDGRTTQLASVHTLTCHASWTTILVLTHRVKELRMEGLHVYIPAHVPPPS